MNELQLMSFAVHFMETTIVLPPVILASCTTSDVLSRKGLVYSGRLVCVAMSEPSEEPLENPDNVMQEISW